jgi:hypothetical protein
MWVHGYALVMTNSLLLKMAIEIGSFPIKNGGSVHSFLQTFTRGYCIWSLINGVTTIPGYGYNWIQMKSANLST